MIIYKFKIKNEENHFLNIIMKGINNDFYVWKSSYDEIFYRNNDFVFNDEIIDNQTFWNALSNQDYYIIHAHMKLYKNQEDLKNDNWILNLEIVDCEFVEIKVLDSEISSKIEENIKDFNYEKILQ